MRSIVCWTAVLLVVAPVALGACGGNDAATAREAPSQKEWARKANRICGGFIRRAKRLAKPKVKTPAEYVRRVKRVRTAFEHAMGRLMLLKKPSGRAGKRAQDFLEAADHEYVRQLLPLIRRAVTAVRGHDLVGALTVGKKLRAFSRKRTRAGGLALRLGLHTCAKD